MDLTFVSNIFYVLQITPPSKLTLLDAQALASAHVLPYPPDMPALLTNVNSPRLALHLKDVLLTSYPKEHAVFVVEDRKKKEERLIEFANDEVSEGFSLYIPALGEGTS